MYAHLSCQRITYPGFERSTPKTLEADQIYLWNLEIEQYLRRIQELNKLLSPEEILRAECFHHKNDAQRYIVTHAILRLLLADYHACAPAEIKLVAGQNHKPQLFENNGLHFNISHSNQLAVIGISNQEIGLDLEFINKEFDYMHVAKFAFSAAELANLNQSQEPVNEFFCIWTRKEAFLKGTGIGLTDMMDQFSCLDTDNILPPALNKEGKSWTMNTMKLPGDYFLSICATTGKKPLKDQLFLFDFSHAAL